MNLLSAFSTWSSWLSPHCRLELRPPSRLIAFCGVAERKPPRHSRWNANHIPFPRPCKSSSIFWIARRRYTGPDRFPSGKLGRERRPTGSPYPRPPLSTAEECVTRGDLQPLALSLEAILTKHLGPPRPPERSPAQVRVGPTVTCIQCGAGHFARDCPRNASPPPPPSVAARSPPRKTGFTPPPSPQRGVCFRCHSPGHFARECPLRSPLRGWTLR